MSEASPSAGKAAPTLPLVIGAIGVVYGDIGTSPLYTLRTAFTGPYGLSLTRENVLGVLSAIVWALVVVVTLKYITLVMRADNRGEGGILAMTALVSRGVGDRARLRWWLVGLGIFGAAMFYGDGMITPAITVLGAVEGLGVIAPQLHPFIVPLTLVIMFVLFAAQRKGTASLGAVFGPIMSVWFASIGVLGIQGIARNVEVLEAFYPGYAVRFALDNPGTAFVAMGAVVLAVTGTEALYADMGHFGKSPIRRAWLFFVLPTLLCNYFGQGALVLANPGAIQNPFYLLAPGWGRLPLLALATAAAIIASQAVISGAYSLTRAAIQMGYCPRLTIAHTSEREIGQIYVPFVNWMLLVAIVALVLGFRSSDNLASAYGIAVTMAMLIDSLLIFVVMRRIWQWAKWQAVLVAAPLVAIDLTFLASNSLKIPDGGWFPLLIGGIVSSASRFIKSERPRFHVVSSVNTAPPTSSGNHPPSGILSELDARNVRSIRRSGSVIAIDSHTGQSHSLRMTTKIRIESISIAVVTAMP